MVVGDRRALHLVSRERLLPRGRSRGSLARRRSRQVLSPNGVSPSELLQLAASLDRDSAHVLGEALVRAADESNLRPSTPMSEEPGQTIRGVVVDHTVGVGSPSTCRS